MTDPRIAAIPDVHGHAKGEHRPYSEERPLAYSARMLFLWFYHACRRLSPRFLMVADHANYLTFEDPGAVNTLRRALKLAQAGDLLGAAETAGVDVAHAAIVSEGLRRGMRFSIGAEMDNDPRARPDAQNIIDAMRPDGIIRSVHFVSIHHPEKGADWQWPFDNEEFAHLYDVVGVDQLWELYMAKLLEDVEKLPTHIVGHFFVPATLGRWPTQKKLEEYEDRLLDVAHRRGLAIEINTRFLYRDHPEDRKKKYLDANARLIRKAKARGVGIAIGSDAHSPKDQGNAFDLVLKLLDDAKINEIVFPVAGRLARGGGGGAPPPHQRGGAERPSSITGYSRAELGLPEEAEGVSGRSGRDGGPKRRAAASSTPSTSRRSAESSSSASKAKSARAPKPPTPVKQKAAKNTAPARKKRPPSESAQKRKKPAAKPAAGRSKKASPTRTRPKKTPTSRSAGRKAPVKRSAAKKQIRKKAPAKKTPSRRLAKPQPKRIKKKKPAAKRR
jgi:HisJ family histidinol phosphate phosphatase